MLALAPKMMAMISDHIKTWVHKSKAFRFVYVSLAFLVLVVVFNVWDLTERFVYWPYRDLKKALISLKQEYYRHE